MRPLRSIPIQGRLRVVMLTTCSAALIVACGALFAFQLVLFRKQFDRDLQATAEMLADQSAAALAWQDASAADELLGVLRAKPHITGAAFVLADGTTLAGTDDRLWPAGAAAPAAGLHGNSGQLVFVRPIEVEGERLGTLVLHSDYGTEFEDLLRLYASILVAVLGISFVVAMLVASRLERVILAPVQTLARAARKIETEHDYTVRAQKLVEDEIGSFTDSFNSMLDQIEHQDWELRREIAERARAEEELQRVHRELVDASRQAGMAEVATDVLHNVGNVLNSVNVSATLLAEMLGSSRVGNLMKAAGLLREQDERLGTFLTEDPRGRALPGYLADASERLERERAESLGEVERLAKNIAHLRDIVATQQSYARTAGFIEPWSLEALIEDALRMCAGELNRGGIAVIRVLSPTPPAAVDRHKVLQILVNLLRNAVNALDDTEPEAKRVMIRLSHDGKSAEIRVADSGAGILEENLTRIFSHGFTTRREGHGFGLHSAALAAQEMRGQLRAESEGPGCGATFVLHLPLAEPMSAA